MNISVHIDFSKVNATLARIHEYAQVQAKLDAAEIARGDIIRKSALGIDADNHPFSAYTAQYKKVRAKKNRPLSPKDLRVTGKLLDGIFFDKGQSALLPAPDMEKIAEGQMYHPGWSAERHSMFFLVGNDTAGKIAETLAVNVLQFN